MADEPRSRLGRGLAALIGESADATAAAAQVAGAAGKSAGQKKVPTEFIKPNPRNPRKVFHDSDLEDLTNSIREKGIIQPILVRGNSTNPDLYELIAGERRWRAAQKAGVHEVPVIVVDVSDKEALEIAIIENVQRADLDPIEEALGYEQLIAEFAYSQTDLAKVIGKSRPHVANTLRLARLPDSVKALIHSGKLTAGHARALLSVKDPEAVAKRVVERGLTVRDVEKIAQDETEGHEPKSAKAKPQKDSDTRALEQALERLLGLTVIISHGKNGGELKIKYTTLDQLDAVCRRLGN